MPGKIPTTYCKINHGLKSMKQEQGLLIQQKIMMGAEGLEPLISRW
jgi:hypothetical protein